MSKKYKPLHPGGIAFVCTPQMRDMAKRACKTLRQNMKKRMIDFHVLKYKPFSRGEVLPRVHKNVRGKNVYLFYDFNGEACHDAFVLQLTIAALQDALVKSITLVAPYMPFLRQDRKDRGRVPISAKEFIRGYDRFYAFRSTITIHPHTDQAMGFGEKPFDHLPGHAIFIPWLRETFADRLQNVVLVAPDTGAEKRVKAMSRKVGCKRAFFVKDHPEEGPSEVSELHGADVVGKICVINDDMMDTCGTMASAVDELRAAGAAEVYLTATHAVFGGNAYETLSKKNCQVVVTDSLRNQPRPWLTVLPLGDYLAFTILQNEIEEGSVSDIIENGLPD